MGFWGRFAAPKTLKFGSFEVGVEKGMPNG
jgi:hypothetical protein